jgi:hypothetical protein
LDDIELGGNQPDQGKDEQDKYLLNDDVYFHELCADRIPVKIQKVPERLIGS